MCFLQSNSKYDLQFLAHVRFILMAFFLYYKIHVKIREILNSFACIIEINKILSLEVKYRFEITIPLSNNTKSLKI